MFQAPQTTFAPQRPDSAQRQRIATILEKVAAMLECFPDRADAPNGMVQAETIARIFAEYPDEVVNLLTDPIRGFPVRQKWKPLPYEVKAACEAEMAPIRRENERRRRHEETRMMLAPPPREERPSLEVMQERYGGDQWGIARASDRKEAKPAKTLAELEAEASSLELEFSPELRAHLESKTQ